MSDSERILTNATWSFPPRYSAEPVIMDVLRFGTFGAQSEKNNKNAMLCNRLSQTIRLLGYCNFTASNVAWGINRRLFLMNDLLTKGI